MKVVNACQSRFWCMLALTILALLLANGLVLASDLTEQKIDLNYDEPQTEATPGMAGLLLRLVISLLLILGLAWIVMQVFGKQVSRKFQGQWVQVLDEVVLGQNRGIILCEVGGKVYALGVTDHQITTLFEVQDQGLIEAMLKKGFEERAGPSPTGIAAWLEVLKPTRLSTSSREPERHFHTLMDEQVQKLQDIRLRQAGSRNNRERRNDDE